MSPRKREPGIRDKSAERHINLVMFLQSKKQGVTKEEIAARVQGYEDTSDDAFNRKFERDKAELLAAGILIEKFNPDPWDENFVKYRIQREKVLLPPLELSANEAKIAAYASLAWANSPNAAQALDVHHKLETLGCNPSADQPVASTAAIADLEPLVQAITQRKKVKFAYRKPGDDTATMRSIEPWGIAVRKATWYVYGHDVEKKATRVFALTRVEGDVTAYGVADSFTIPENIDVSEIISPTARSEEESVTLVLQVRSNSGIWWRQRALDTSLAIDQDGIIEFEARSPRTLIGRLAADAPGVVVLEPSAIRTAVVQLLEAANNG